MPAPRWKAKGWARTLLELGNSAADSGQLPTVLAAVLRAAGADPKQVLADAGYRSEATFEQLREHPAELIVALGREGKRT